MNPWIFQFVIKVWRMRKHQKAWFLDHGLHDLSEAKRYEAEVDKALRECVTVEDGEPKELNIPEEPAAEPKQADMFAKNE